MFTITWLWAMALVIQVIRSYREMSWRLSLTMLGMPILDLECQLHFQIGN